MGYTLATIRALVALGTEVHVVHWDHRKRSPYVLPHLSNVYMHERSKLSVDAMQTLAEEISPAITVVSGWNDKGYLKVIKRLRARGNSVVMGLDGQWHGSLRQRLAALLGGIGYLSKYFSHAWVSGAYQFEYARRLGFKKSKIVYDLYSADLSLFRQAYNDYLLQKKSNYPHRFLFVGRLESIKGLDTMLQAWRMLSEKRLDWELQLIGDGSLKSAFESTEGVVLREFMQPSRLVQEVSNVGCFILPSRSEPWGVVVHEFAGAGMPLIVSDVVGAASTFLISGLNGFRFEANNPKSLSQRMADITDLNDQELLAMSDHSNRLSQRITPESSAANLLSCAEL